MLIDHPMIDHTMIDHTMIDHTMIDHPMIDHPILVHRLHTDYGFTDTVHQWFSSYLTDRTHYVSLSNHCSAFAPVHSGVPQGSVLGPIHLTMYIKPLSAIIDSYSIIHHSFADDLQPQMSAPPNRISELLHSMQSCNIWQHLVIVHFLLLHLLSGTLYQMMSSVPHHCHHLSLIWRHTGFVQFTKTELYPWSLYICAWLGLVIALLMVFLKNALMCTKKS